jgi:hypothetical protein
MPPARKLTTVSDPATATNRLKAQAVIEFNDAHNIRYNKSDVWKHFHVSRSTGYRALAAAKRPPPDPDEPERRGRKRKIPREEQRKLEEYLENNGGVPPDIAAAAAAVANVEAVGDLGATISAMDVTENGGLGDDTAAAAAAAVTAATAAFEDGAAGPPDSSAQDAAHNANEAKGDGDGDGDNEVGDDAVEKSGKGGNWTHVASAAGLHDVHWRTVRRAIGSLDYLYCTHCYKRWISNAIKTQRMDVARRLILERPASEHWRDVCFTGTWHLRLQPNGKLSRLPKSGERLCWKCVPDVNRLPEKDVWRIHCWAMVGYGFKSAIVFYEGPTMPTGDMNQKVYIEQILEPHVKPLAQQQQQQMQQSGQPGNIRRLVLFEENEPGYGPVESGQNRARNWKEANGVGYLFNAPRSRDLNIIEECWSPMEEYVCSIEHNGDKAKVEEAIVKAWWERVDQNKINAAIDSMPSRLYSVLNHEGGLTEF